MDLNISDKNNYLMGILTLVGKERFIDNADEKLIRRIADELGFNHYFVDQSIEGIKGNKFIIEEPPEFSNQEIAEVFIKDAIRFAFCDKSLHLYELHWLSVLASKNKLSGTWLSEQINFFLKSPRLELGSVLEIQKYI